MDPHANDPSTQQPGNPVMVISTEATVVLPVIEEAVQISKREIETGVVTITREVTEQTKPVHVVVSHDECTVVHVPAGYYVEQAPQTRSEGDTTIIPVLREEAVVVKKLFLVEEIHITQRSVQTTQTEHVPIRREDIRVTRTASDGAKEIL